MAEIATLVLEVKSEGIQQATDSLDELTSSSKTVEKQTKSTTSSFNNADKAAQKASGGFRAMKGATQQVSYQLQDIAVQAQMGTSAFIILGQQGPQLASIFGPGGAVLGAFIAFGAMIGGTLVNAFSDAEGGSKELENALDRLSSQIKRTKNGTIELSERIADLGKVSAAAASAEIISAMSDAMRSLKSTKNEVDLLVDGIGHIDFEIMTDQLKNLKSQGITAEQILGETGSYTGQAGTINAALDEIANKFDLVGKAGKEQALQLVEAITGLDAQDVSTYENLRNVIDNIATSQRELNVPFAEFRRNLNTEINQIKDLTETTSFLTKARQDLRRDGVGALATITEGAQEAAESVRNLEKREEEAAQKKAAREKLIADQQLKTMQDGIDKRLAAALAADDTEIERVNNLLAQKLDALETDRMSSIMMAEQKGQDTMAIEQKYQEATVALNYAAQGEIAAILENQRATDLEKQATYMSEWMRITSESMNNLDMLGFNMATSLQGNLAGAFEGFITGAKSAEESFKQFATGIAQALVHALSNMAAQWAAYWIVEKIMGKTAQATAGTAMTFNALAGQQLAAINAFASTAAIPIFGPALAPAAAAGAIAATAPFVAATAALSTAATGARALGGQVRGGQSYLVGERGPELLTMGTSGRIATNENLKNAMGGGGVTVVNNVNASGSGPDVELKIRTAMEQTNAQTIATIQDLMRRRRFV